MRSDTFTFVRALVETTTVQGNKKKNLKILMASMLSRQIQCAVCWNSLRDPVCLPCQHSFCEVCITRHSTVNENSCPECRRAFSAADIRVNRTLRNIVDAARAYLQEQEALTERIRLYHRGQDQCPDHHQNFGFFCKNDQKLACEACRREERHQGHRFTNLSQAHQSKKVMPIYLATNDFQTR